MKNKISARQAYQTIYGLSSNPTIILHLHALYTKLFPGQTVYLDHAQCLACGYEFKTATEKKNFSGLIAPVFHTKNASVCIYCKEILTLGQTDLFSATNIFYTQALREAEMYFLNSRATDIMSQYLNAINFELGLLGRRLIIKAERIEECIES